VAPYGIYSGASDINYCLNDLGSRDRQGCRGILRSGSGLPTVLQQPSASYPATCRLSRRQPLAAPGRNLFAPTSPWRVVDLVRFRRCPADFPARIPRPIVL